MRHKQYIYISVITAILIIPGFTLRVTSFLPVSGSKACRVAGSDGRFAETCVSCGEEGQGDEEGGKG